MPKCVPMTRSSELRPLTLLLYVVPVTLMELLRRWGSGTTSGSGGGGGGGGGGGTGTHTHVFAMQECKGLQHLGWLHFTELAILFKIPKNDPWLSSGHTSLQILSHPGHSSPKSLKRSRLTSLSCLEMFKKLLRFLNQKMVSPTNWKNWETVSEEVVIMHRNMSQAKPWVIATRGFEWNHSEWRIDSQPSYHMTCWDHLTQDVNGGWAALDGISKMHCRWLTVGVVSITSVQRWWFTADIDDLFYSSSRSKMWALASSKEWPLFFSV